MFDLPQDVLNKVLATYKQAPERLTPGEIEIAKRIEVCTECQAVWVRRIKNRPIRCPRCFSRAWDRPLINALVAGAKATTPATPNATPTTGHNGGQP